jgi:hypothetical protein
MMTMSSMKYKHHDLEPLMDAGEELRELKDAIYLFGHSDCHELTLALHDNYGAPIVGFASNESNIPVHSCVLLDENTTLDAYGINPLSTTLSRYSAICQSGLEEPAIVLRVDRTWVERQTLFDIYDDEKEDIMNGFQPILTHLGVDLDALYELPTLITS